MHGTSARAEAVRWLVIGTIVSATVTLDHTAEYNTEEEELQPGPSKKSKSAKALPQNCTRNDLSRPEIQNFPGGACPQTPLAAREPIAFCFNVTHAKFANLAGMD